MRLARIAAIGGALAVGTITTLALGSPSLATSPSPAGVDPSVSVSTSIAPSSIPASVTPSSQAPSSAVPVSPSRSHTSPAAKPTTTAPTKPGVTQTCKITTDVDHTRINGGITETCMNINGTMQWGKGSKNVTQTCMIATDINKSRIRDGINETCVNENQAGGPAKYQWHPTDSNVTQTCASAADLNRVRVQGGIQYTCDNITGKTGPDAKYGWHKAGNINQTCTVDVDLSHTTITGDVNVTCVNTIVAGKPTVAWVPNAGQKCPTAEINGGKCVEAPAPALYGVCSVTGEIYMIGAKTCSCAKPPAQLPAGVTAPPAGTDTVWVPQDQANAAVVPFQEAAQTGSLPVTGDNTMSIALIGGGVLLGGAVLLTLAYRRHNRVRFTA